MFYLQGIISFALSIKENNKTEKILFQLKVIFPSMISTRSHNFY